MEKILAKLELWGSCIRVRVWTWPERRDLLRARLSASPQHGRAALELLESVARWEGQPVHAVVIVDESVRSIPSGAYPDLLRESTPLVVRDGVILRSMSYHERSALHLRGHGRDEPRLPPMSARGWDDDR